jgi:hypothetical protein
MSTYEGEHTIFALLSQANLTQNDVLQFHPFTVAGALIKALDCCGSVCVFPEPTKYHLKIG